MPATYKSSSSGRETVTTVVRPDGSRIVTVVDDDGRLIRRMRRDQRGRDIIIIDNGPPRPRGMGLLPLDRAGAPGAGRSRASATSSRPSAPIATMIYDTLLAPPVERIDRRYSLDEIR